MSLAISGVKFTDENSPKHEAHLSVVPIHIVTHRTQLPVEFLEPSSEIQLVIGFDCEGVDLCRHGTLCVMQVDNHNWFSSSFLRLCIDVNSIE